MAGSTDATPGDLDVGERPLPVREQDCHAEAVIAAAGDLAYEFAEFGPARIEEELVRFVQAARRRGAGALLGSIVLDRSEPDVARQRAFGAVHHQVAQQAGEVQRNTPRVGHASNTCSG